MKEALEMMKNKIGSRIEREKGGEGRCRVLAQKPLEVQFDFKRRATE